MLRIEAVEDLKEIRRGYRQLFENVYRDVRGWHAPPFAFHKARLDPRQEPIWREARKRLLFAYRDGKVAGRLLPFAVPGPQGTEGRFAFFDTADDPEVVDALFAAATAWLREQGCAEVAGPFAFSMHDEVGLLVEGFELPPAFMMPFNPPHAAAHLARLGFEEVRRFTTYEWELARDQIPLRSDRKDLKLPGLTLRPFSLERRDDDTRALLEVYNAGFSDNWGFEPLSPEGARSFVDQFITFGDPRLVRIAELDGKPAGFCLCVPDPNRLLHETRGQPDFLRLARLIVAVKLRRFRFARVITLAVLPQHRRSGIGHALVRDVATAGRELGYVAAELSYVDAGNDAMNVLLTGLEFPRRKRYAVYRKELA
jgi:ribosomal protein S18 acetylase RimI-like enzyme